MKTKSGDGKDFVTSSRFMGVRGLFATLSPAAPCPCQYAAPTRTGVKQIVMEALTDLNMQLHLLEQKTVGG
jgi:hypothetical protein